MRRARPLAALVGVALATFGGDALGRSETAAPKHGCAVEGVRVFLHDQGDATTVEISTRLSPLGAARATCTVDW